MNGEEWQISIFVSKMKFQALRRRHHTVSSTTGQNTAIEEAKKINMSRDKRHQTIDNSQSVSTSLFQVSQKVLRFSTDWCYEVLRFAILQLRCILSESIVSMGWDRSFLQPVSSQIGNKEFIYLVPVHVRPWTVLPGQLT